MQATEEEDPVLHPHPEQQPPARTITSPHWPRPSRTRTRTRRQTQQTQQSWVRWVYAIRNPSNRHVKIGIANSLQQRLRTLQTAHAERLHIEARCLCVNARAVETFVHTWLRERGDGLGGEWFRTRPPQVRALFRFLRFWQQRQFCAWRADGRWWRLLLMFE